MILFGCLLAFGAAVAPRVILILAWIFSDRWDAVWRGDFLLPLLGIIFLPYTTIMYLLTWTLVGGIAGWDWLWIILGLILDFMKWGQMLTNRKEGQAQAQQYYPSGAPKSPTGTTSSATAGSSTATGPSSSSDSGKATVPSTVADVPAGDAAPAGAGNDKMSDLDRLTQMHQSGALTDEEFAAAKAKLEG